MKRVRSVRLEGPFPWWADLFPPRRGYKWVYLTTLDHAVVDTVRGDRVALPMPYLMKLPQVKVITYWELQAEIESMRDDSVKKQVGGKWEPSDDPFLQGLEHLNAQLTDFWWEDAKKPRTPCKLAIQFFGEMVNIALNDEEKRRSMHTTAPTVREALELMEGRLAAGAIPWRPWGKQKWSKD